MAKMKDVMESAKLRRAKLLVLKEHFKLSNVEMAEKYGNGMTRARMSQLIGMAKKERGAA